MPLGYGGKTGTSGNYGRGASTGSTTGGYTYQPKAGGPVTFGGTKNAPTALTYQPKAGGPITISGSFTPQKQINRGGGVTPPQTLPSNNAPLSERKKVLLIHPLQDEVDKLKILSSLRSRFGGMGTAKNTNIPFRQQDNFIPMNIDGSVGLNIA